VKNLTQSTEKSLSVSLRSDRLWSKIKVRAAELRHGRLSIDLVVDGGHVVRAEVTAQRESLIAD